MAILGTDSCIYCWTYQENNEVIYLDLEGCFGSDSLEGQRDKGLLPTDVDCHLCVICRACHGHENVSFRLCRPAASQSISDCQIYDFL